MKRQILVWRFSACWRCASPVWAEQSGGLDWSAWQRMPVLQDGRIMPLDSFARAQVKKICGDVRPQPGETRFEDECRNEFAFPGRDQAPGERGPAAAIPGRGTPLRMDRRAGEMGRRAVPACRRRRRCGPKSSDVPLLGEDGSRLRYVSPRQVRLSKKFARSWRRSKPFEQAQQKKQRPDILASAGKGQKSRRGTGVVSPVELRPCPRRATPIRWLENDFVGMQKSWDDSCEALSQHPRLTVQRRICVGSARRRPRLPPAENLLRELFQLADKTDPAMREFVTQWGPVQNGQETGPEHRTRGRQGAAS